MVYTLSECSASQMSEHKSFLQRNIIGMQDIKTNTSLFSFLNLHWNYLSPQLLYHIVNELPCLQNAKKQIISYDLKLIEFRINTLLRLFCEIDQEYIEPPKGFFRIAARFESENMKEPTLQHIEKFRLKYAKFHNLRDFALMLVTEVKVGSFIVSFAVPFSIIDSLKYNVPTEIMKEFGIKTFLVGNARVFHYNLVVAQCSSYTSASMMVVDKLPSTPMEIVVSFFLEPSTYSLATAGIQHATISSLPNENVTDLQSTANSHFPEVGSSHPNEIITIYNSTDDSTAYSHFNEDITVGHFIEEVDDPHLNVYLFFGGLSG